MQTESSTETTVLVADDEPLVLSVVERVLQSSGYDVLVAENGIRALQVAETHPGPVHILLTDLKMPDLDGVSLAKLLRRVRPDVRVILMSGCFDRSLKAHEGWTFLQKPFAPGALLETARLVLRKEPEPLADMPEIDAWLR